MRVLTDKELDAARTELERAISNGSGLTAKELRTRLAIVYELQNRRAQEREELRAKKKLRDESIRRGIKWARALIRSLDKKEANP